MCEILDSIFSLFFSILITKVRTSRFVARTRIHQKVAKCAYVHNFHTSDNVLKLNCTYASIMCSLAEFLNELRSKSRRHNSAVKQRIPVRLNFD